MTRWRILLARTRFIQVTDSTAIGLWVKRDGGRYQYFTIEASGPQLRLDHKWVADEPRFWDAAAMVGAIQIRELLVTVTPLEEPTLPFKVPSISEWSTKSCSRRRSQRSPRARCSWSGPNGSCTTTRNQPDRRHGPWSPPTSVR